jgi:hypothetical protein
MTEKEPLDLENDAVILRALNYLRDQLAAPPWEDPVALQNAIVDQIAETRDSLPVTTRRRTLRLGM